MTQQNAIPSKLTTTINLDLSRIDKINRWCAILLAFMIPITSAGKNIVGLIVLLLFLSSGQWHKKITILKNNPLVILSLILYIALAIGVLYSGANTYSHALARLMKYNKLLLIPVIIYLFQDTKYKKIGIYFFVSAMLLTVLIGYLHFFTGMKMPSGSYNPGRIFIHYIITPAFMAFTAIFCLQKFITTLNNNLIKITWLTTALATIYYVYFISGTRSGYLLQSILLIYFGYNICTTKHNFNIAKSWPRVLLLIAMLGIIFPLGIKYTNMFTARVFEAKSDVTKFQNNQAFTSNGARLSWYVNAPKIIAKKPIFGYGTGSLTDVYAQNFAGKNMPLTTNPHNQYIEIAFQLGIFGLALLLALLFFAYKNVAEDPLINLMGKSAIITIAIGSCFNSWLLDLAPGFFLCYFAALTNKPYLKHKNN